LKFYRKKSRLSSLFLRENEKYRAACDGFESLDFSTKLSFRRKKRNVGKMITNLAKNFASLVK
jgi:hypothetical protein